MPRPRTLGASLACWIVLLGGCTAPPRTPADVPLQDPLPGSALVYLMRTPHDPVTVELFLTGRPYVTLPPETYTVLSLPPGKYSLATTAIAANGNRQVVADLLALELRPGIRSFYVLSGINERAKELPSLNAMITRPLSAVSESSDRVAKGSREWKESGELETRSMVTVTRLVLPPP